MNKEMIVARLRLAFGRDRVISRLIAAWCCFVALTLIGDAEFSNLGFRQDKGLFSVVLYTVLLFAAFSVAAFFAGELFHSDSWFMILGASVCVLRWLLIYEHATNEFLFTLAVIAIYTLFIVWFLQVNASLLQRWQPGKRTVWIIGGVVALVSCVVISVITCLRYQTFSSPNFDFGLFCNMFHNMKETGLPMVTSERDQLLSHFAVHISPIFYLLLPFYWLFPSPMTLQIGQAVALAAGVIPVILLARHFKLSGKVTVLVAALYAFFPALSGGCFYDIHENCFLPLFLLLTFLFYEKKKYIPMYLSAFCVLMVKEDAAIYLLIFALFILLSEKKALHGGILAALSVGYFVLAVFLLEKFGTGTLNNRLDNLIYDKDAGLVSVVKMALNNPGFLLTQLFTTSKGTWDKVMYLLQLLLPLGFLPFCTKKASRWLLITPILINMVSYYQYLYDIGFQYHFASAAFLIYAVLKNLPELAPITRRNLLGLAAASCCCIYLVTVVPKLTTYTNRWENNKETYQQMEEILETVPQDASVNCSSFLLAHLADRDEIYEVNYHGNEPDVDYVVLDARYESHLKTKVAYIAQGYTVETEYPNLIVILKKP